MAGVCEQECIGLSMRVEPLTLMRYTVVGCHSYIKPMKGGSQFVAEPTT